jgi:hypothetical protein
VSLCDRVNTTEWISLNLICNITSITKPNDVTGKLTTVSGTDIGYFLENIQLLTTGAVVAMEVRCMRSLKLLTKIGNIYLRPT